MFLFRRKNKKENSGGKPTADVPNGTKSTSDDSYGDGVKLPSLSNDSSTRSSDTLNSVDFPYSSHKSSFDVNGTETVTHVHTPLGNDSKNDIKCSHETVSTQPLLLPPSTPLRKPSAPPEVVEPMSLLQSPSNYKSIGTVIYPESLTDSLPSARNSATTLNGICDADIKYPNEHDMMLNVQIDAQSFSSLQLLSDEKNDTDVIESDDGILYELTDDEEDEEMRNFFPATRASFTELAGEVKRVTKLDFQDDNRRRHLECFAKSMDHWKAFDQKDSISYQNFSFSKINFERYNEFFLNVDTKNFTPLQKFICELVKSYNKDMKDKEFNILMSKLRRRYRIAPSKRELFEGLETLQATAHHTSDDVNVVKVESQMKYLLRNKATRSNSGVVVITVMTSPGSFSCSENCHYCPNEPGQPRSYLSTEPAVLRANQNSFDSIKQFYDRATTLYKNGHIIDKIEIIVLGGTWSGYPRQYQQDFIRDLFYAANIFPEPIEGARAKESLEEEHRINETAKSRIVGLTLETRPDRITPYEIELLRKFGCTRVQLGIQHTDNDILRHVNRGHTIEDSIKAIYLLKENCFKVDIHIMPDLPSSTPAKDYEMFDRILTSEDLQVDQWKIYPCEVTPFTEIEKWHKKGLYVPYFDVDKELMLNLLMSVKRAVHPWIRLNRVIRDIPDPSIIAGTKITNMRQLILEQMAKRKIKCKCIRCREVKDATIVDAKLIVRQYRTKGGTEYFLSYENHNQTIIYGFLRLRIRDDSSFNPKVSTFKALEDCALIRELHVYGIVVAHGKTSDEKIPSQHRGIGSSLLLAAEIISIYRGLWKVAIIAGVGTREYYSKFGYVLMDTFMIKELNSNDVMNSYRNNIHSNRLIKLPQFIEISEVNLMNSSLHLYSKLPDVDHNNSILMNNDELAFILPNHNRYIINVKRLLNYTNWRNDKTGDYSKDTKIMDVIYNFIDEFSPINFVNSIAKLSIDLTTTLINHPYTCASVAFFAYTGYKNLSIA